MKGKKTSSNSSRSTSAASPSQSYDAPKTFTDSASSDSDHASPFPSIDKPGLKCRHRAQPPKPTPGHPDNADRTQDELFSPTCIQQRPMPYNNDEFLPLYTIDSVPQYLRDNQYIHRAYRAYYTTARCVSSVFRMHNETLNIWTHLLGGLMFIALTFYLFVHLLIPDYIAGNRFQAVHTADGSIRRVRVKGERTRLPLVIFGYYSFSCLACMLCSAFFHTFLAHLSERWYHWAHSCDYFGITFLIVGSFLPFCYYVFECEPFWRNVYLIMIFTFGVVGALGPFFRHWTSPAFAMKKILFYVCMVGSGMFPILHIALVLPANVGGQYVCGLLTMMILYGVGVLIYAVKVPESFYPGKFDLLFSSHQLWHLCVVGAALTHFFNCVKMYTNADQLVCKAQ